MSFASKWLKWGSVCGFVLAAGGCAEERAPINKVQANALEKSFFIGADLAKPDDDPEFYTAATVVDVPLGADQAGVFPGLVGGLRRVKWEILEDVLNARLTYEEIEGSDGHGNRRVNNGRVIGAWHIESHFDIKRAYNATTGEELNVIEENVTDRPWYERKYFRVDWSQNLVASSMWWDPIAQQGAFGDSFESESLQYYVDDPNNPDAPVFDAREGYFDITNKLYLKPKKVTVFGQTVNACLYRGSIVIGATSPWGNCENSEVTLRYSFKKVAQPGEIGSTDYEPFHWDGSRMNAFGAFTQDRMGWDDRYGIIDNEWRRFIQRYNIWERSHADLECNTPDDRLAKLDPHADADKNGTEDQCEAAGAGSRCDDLSGLCTIPYAKRNVRPVVWRYTVGPQDDTLIFDFTKKATYEWDIAIRQAVQAARLVECRRTNGASVEGVADASGCDAKFPVKAGEEAKDMEPSVADIRPMVVLCHNPVVEGDDVACGAVGTKVRPGDIRHHHVNVWPTRHSSSPWGYGPTLADPLTGEAISAGINVYNAVTDSAAQSFVDQLRWIGGELKSADISTGSYIRDWIESDLDSGSKAAQQVAGGPRMTKAEIDKRLLGIQGMTPDALAAVKANQAKVDMRKMREQLKKDLWWNRLPLDSSGVGRAEYDQRIEAAKGSKIEAKLMNGMWEQLAGVDPSMPVDDTVLEQASPLRGMRSHVLREAEQQIHKMLAQRGQCMLGAPEPTGLPALSKIMRKKFPVGDSESPQATKARVDKMWNYLRARMHYAVIAHEMGHTVGFRHNFVSSYDKFNWRPQYWQLRTANDKVNEPCKDAMDDGATCVGPRYWDPMTKDEMESSIWTWQHTTTMDYAGDLTQDMMGLGVYDYAGARFFYGDVVDVLNDPELVATVRDQDNQIVVDGTEAGDEVAGIVDYAGGLVGQIVSRPGSGGSEVMHYSEWNKWFHFIRNCKSADTSPPADWDSARDGEYDPVVDGHIVLGTKCERIPVDYVAYTDLVPDQLSDQQGTNPRFFTSRRARDGKGRPRAPYGFESDEYADGWSPSTYRHDNGGDLYEELTFHSNLYENRHIFDNFRNGRVNFTVYGAYQRALSRYHYKISSLTQGVAYLAGFYLREYAKNMNFPFSTVLSANMGPGSWGYDATVGAAIGFDHFARVLTRPHPGAHFPESSKPDAVLVPEEDLIWSTPVFDLTLVDVPNGTSIADSGDVSFGAKPLNNDFQFGQGYWSIDYLNTAGSYYEKTYAFEAMLEASYRSFNFWRFDGLDARFHHINYSDLWADGLRRMLGSMLTGDRALFAPRVTAGPSGLPSIIETTDGLRYPKDALGWVSYIAPNGPEVCFPVKGVLQCSDGLGNPIAGGTVPASRAIDPQLGFEVQKFIVFWSYVYLPGAQNNDWVDMMRLYVVGPDKDPDYLPKQRVEWRDPESGLRYVARRYGNETLLGKTYDKGIGAKVIQWANALTAEAYELDATQPFDPDTGAANVVLDSNGMPVLKGATACEDSKKCSELRGHRGLMDFMRDTAARLGFPEPALQVYGNE